MTIDKIKHYINENIFNFWVNCKDINRMQKAYNLLLLELNQGILQENKCKYVAELHLLSHLLEIKQPNE
jgi:hypothetical protein